MQCDLCASFLPGMDQGVQAAAGLVLPCSAGVQLCVTEPTLSYESSKLGGFSHVL